jgi:hypothetical protein
MHCGVQLGPEDAFCPGCGTATQRDAGTGKSNFESQPQLPDSPSALPAASPSLQGIGSSPHGWQPKIQVPQPQVRVKTDTAKRAALIFAAAAAVLVIIAAVVGSKLPSETSKPAANEQASSQMPDWMKQDLAAISGGLADRVAGKQIASSRRGIGSQIDPNTKLGLIHENLLILRATIQTALYNLDKNPLPAWLRDRASAYREGLLDIRNGVDMQLLFWNSGDKSLIESGDEKINGGVDKLTKFAQSLSLELKGKPKRANRRPDVSNRPDPNEFIGIEYRRFKDETCATADVPLGHFDSGKFEGGTDSLTFKYFCHGNTIHCHPDLILMDFYSNPLGGGWRFTHDHDIDFLADGVRVIPMSSAEPQWDVTSTGREAVVTAFHPHDFLKLAKAHKLELRVGGVEYAIRTETNVGMQRLAEVIRR